MVTVGANSNIRFKLITKLVISTGNLVYICYCHSKSWSPIPCWPVLTDYVTESLAPETKLILGWLSHSFSTTAPLQHCTSQKPPIGPKIVPPFPKYWGLILSPVPHQKYSGQRPHFRCLCECIVTQNCVSCCCHQASSLSYSMCRCCTRPRKCYPTSSIQ